MRGTITFPARRARLLGALTAVTLMVFGLTAIVYCVAGDARGLTAEMRRFAPSESTGLPDAVYPEMGRHLADYLTEKKENFQFLLEDENGTGQELFHGYELVHMADCRALLSLDRTVCLLAGVLSAAGLVLLTAMAPDSKADFARGARNGLWFCCAAAGVLLGWALIDFDGFFVAFHRLAFRNDLWLLSPRTDLLIRLLPETLFIDLGIRGLTVATVWLLLLLTGFRRLKKRVLQ